jgi:hypothetical protein
LNDGIEILDNFVRTNMPSNLPNEEGIIEFSEGNQTIILKYLYNNSNQFKEWFLDNFSTAILTIFKNFNDIVIENNPDRINEEVCTFINCVEGGYIERPRLGK